MSQQIRGGTARPIDRGLLERVSQKLRATFDVWFGPLEPMAPVAPADTPPRRFDYPSGVNLVTQPRSNEPVTFQQMRALADSLDLVRIAIETRKDQVSKMPWSFRAKMPLRTSARAAESTASTTSTESTSSRIDELTDFFQSPDREHDFDEWLRMIL